MKIKTDKRGVGGAMIALFIILGALVAGGAFYAVSQTQASPSDILKDTGNCDTDPYLEVYQVNKVNAGTAITAVTVAGWKTTKEGVKIYQPSITEGTSGTTYSIGDTVDLLVSNSTHVDVIIEGYEIKKCGENAVPVEMYQLLTDPTLKVFNDDGNVVTDSATGGATNQTARSTPINMKLDITLASDEGASDWVCVGEFLNDTVLKDITMSSSEATVTKFKNNKPDSHTTESSDGDALYRSWTISGMKGDGATTGFNILFEPASGRTYTESVNTVGQYLTCYPAQAYVDTDGTFKVGIEDSVGTAKFVAARDNDYDWATTAA